MDQESSRFIAVISHLSGDQRGASRRVHGAVVRLVVGPDRTVRAASGVTQPHNAELRRRGESYELVGSPGQDLWVNGEQVEHLVLASGDIIEIGKDGAVIRFRLYPAESGAVKSMSDVFSDCLACARHERGGVLRRTGVFLAGVPVGLATQTSLRFRVGVVVALTVLIATTVLLAQRSADLEQRLAEGQTQMLSIAALVENTRDNPSTQVELAHMLAQVRDSMTATTQRLGVLEQRSEASSRIIAAATRAVVLLQGSYGFVDSATGRSLRLVPGPGGRPIRGPGGDPLVTLEGEGPVFEVLYTGTGFVVNSDGLILTNRHLAAPWEFDRGARRMMTQGLTPSLLRFIAYLPEVPQPFDVEIVRVSEDADLALLRGALPASIHPLPISTTPVQPGNEVIVLGYPLGIRALMARTGQAFLQQLMEEGDMDFWTAAERLAAEGYIAPLASRGIIGQVTGQAVVYDAQTAQGGSGGPVLSASGEVVAINSAMLPEFGGSNLGVPAEHARRLLEVGN